MCVALQLDYFFIILVTIATFLILFICVRPVDEVQAGCCGYIPLVKIWIMHKYWMQE